MPADIILVVTSTIDYTVDYIINKYSSVKFYRLNVDIIDCYQIIITNSGWYIESRAGKVYSDQIKSIYYRKPMLPDLSEIKLPYRRMVEHDIIGLINGIVDAFDGLVITKPSILRQTENKVYQLQILSQVNIPFPESLIGNAFNMDCQISSKEKIIKPLSQGKIDCGDIFEIFQTNSISVSVGDISLTPVYLQEQVAKSYEVRITCVKGDLWPVRIDSTDKLDWRRASAQNHYSMIPIPESIKHMCTEIMDTLALSFGAFDFIVTPDNEWVFLEINPNGQWLWLEQALGLDISDKLVTCLSKGEKHDLT